MGEEGQAITGPQGWALHILVDHASVPVLMEARDFLASQAAATEDPQDASDQRDGADLLSALIDKRTSA